MEESVVLKVWERSNQEGYVFISSGLRDLGQKSCKPGTWEDKAFKWPEDKKLIVPYIQGLDRAGKDVYWCPHLFNEPKRQTQYALPVSCLHSDLDEAMPPEEIKPSILWESSPKRYAAVWFLDRVLPVPEFENINRALNYGIGADKNGWSVTKVLRIPGCTNHKYHSLPKVKLLRAVNELFEPDNFINWFDKMPVAEEPDDILDQIPIAQSSHKLIKRYQEYLSKDMILKLTMSETEVANEFPDRSSVLFALEHELYKTGIPVSDLIEMLRNSGLNKFKSRKDEHKCWEREFEKVKSHVGKVRSLDSKMTVERPEVLTLADRLSRQLKPPGWLIEGFWPVGSHGIIAGPPKSYKSILVMEMAISIASGVSLFGTYPVHSRGTVLYIQNENPEWSVDDRLHKMLAYKGLETIVDAVETDGKIELVEKPIPFLSVDYNLNLNDESDKEWLEGIVKIHQPKMVILDSLYMMMSGVDENSMKDVAPMMNWLLHNLAKKYNTAVVVLHHWNKNGKGSRDTRMLGSQAFRAWVDSQINAQTEEDEDHTVTFYREFPRSYGTLPPVRVQFLMGEPGTDLYKPTLLEEVKTKSLSCSDVRDDILQRLETGPKTLAELSRGLDKKQVNQELTYLKSKGYLTLADKKYRYVGGFKNE